MRVAALADLHCGAGGSAEIRGVLRGVDDAADVLVFGGDLTNLGLLEEGKALLERSPPCASRSWPSWATTITRAGRRGARRLLADGGVHVLDGSAWEYRSVGFAGTKGFGSGFTPHRLAAFGETAVKAFVDVASGRPPAWTARWPAWRRRTVSSSALLADRGDADR